MPVLPFRPVLTRLAAAGALVIAPLVPGCARESTAPRPPVAAAVRCLAPDTLPGSFPLEDGVRAAIATADVPAAASGAEPASPRKVCNRLVLEPGAFAHRHATDPIDWRPWSRAALDEAAAL